MAVMLVAVRVLIFSRDILSSQSSDGLIREEMSIGSEFEVEGLPLEVVVILSVNGTVKNRLANVAEEEGWHHWIHESDPVLGEPEVDEAISLERVEWVPESKGRWLL